MINRIRTSLCEAEMSGREIDEELEKTLSVDLSKLDETSSLKDTQLARIDCLDECAKKKIVRDLDRYISELLDEILNDTIKAAIERERQQDNASCSSSQLQPSFDISFTFHNNDAKDKLAVSDEGYVNRGFVGSANDPDTLEFCMRQRRDPAILDCVDSGINSVETVELQTSEPEEHNLEQSLMDIIDAKLGGSSIGKSLEDLGMEIDAEDAILVRIIIFSKLVLIITKIYRVLLLFCVKLLVEYLRMLILITVIIVKGSVTSSPISEITRYQFECTC